MYKNVLFVDGKRETAKDAKEAIEHYKATFPKMELDSCQIWDFESCSNAKLQMMFVSGSEKPLCLPAIESLAQEDDRVCLTATKQGAEIGKLERGHRTLLAERELRRDKISSLKRELYASEGRCRRSNKSRKALKQSIVEQQRRYDKHILANLNDKNEEIRALRNQIADLNARVAFPAIHRPGGY